MNKFVIGVIVFIVLFIGGIVWYQSTPGKYDSFAMCLEESGAKFYGAYWCPACQSQKALFGKSKNELPYIECSLPGGQQQTQICKDEKIESYPTWEFADGERVSGEISLAILAEKTGCEIPTE